MKGNSIFGESSIEVHVNAGISDSYLNHLPREVHLHGMHKPYQCDFRENEQKLIDKEFELAE